MPDPHGQNPDLRAQPSLSGSMVLDKNPFGGGETRCSESHNNKSSLLLSFKKDESSFLKKRSKRLLFFMRQLDCAFPLRDVFSGG
jgi:hypothetical protein